MVLGSSPSRLTTSFSNVFVFLLRSKGIVLFEAGSDFVELNVGSTR